MSKKIIFVLPDPLPEPSSLSNDELAALYAAIEPFKDAKNKELKFVAGSLTDEDKQARLDEIERLQNWLWQAVYVGSSRMIKAEREWNENQDL